MALTLPLNTSSKFGKLNHINEYLTVVIIQEVGLIVRMDWIQVRHMRERSTTLCPMHQSLKFCSVVKIPP